ncbi:MAG TPA: carboxypeptidase regulatory-like domain-containing protein [Terriglobales bacterium]|nr:carboxypeptidase regulatory-like domain-containing protein [Terriglobales bacterium]
MRPKNAVRVLIALFCLASSTVLLAQSTGGRLAGRVTDPAGALLPGVKVVLTNVETGVSRQVSTNESGDYTFVEVQPGKYQIECEQTGFKKNVRKDITVEINQVLTLNMTMQLGEAKEVVEVTSEAPLIETTSTQLGAVVNERAVVQLPLNARDTYQLLSLQPGVQSQTGTDLFYGSDRAGVVSVNGGRGRSNNFSVNGGDANDQFANLPAVQPTPDSIEEFRVLTNTFDAEYGRNSGAVVNVVTKSGTNTFHGNVYEFFRNDALNSKGYFDTEKPAFHQNQFGGTLGGPIKKDRTFFFASYEGRRIRNGVSSDQIAVPTDDERAGIFNDSFSGSAGSQLVLDQMLARNGCQADLVAQNPNAGNFFTAGSPFGYHPDPNNPNGPALPGLFSNTTTLGNQIPTSCMDPVALDLMKQFVPPANATLSDGTPVFQSVSGIHKDRTDQFTAKVDHRINDKQNLSAYYYFNDSNLFDPYSKFQAGGSNVLGFGAGTLERYQQANLTHNWTISNNVVNEAHFTYFRESQGTFLHPQRTNLVQNSCATVSPDACFNDGTPGNPTGIHPGLGASREGVPFVALSGGFQLGNNFEGEIPQTGNTYQGSDSLSWVKGAHTMKFGADVRRQLFDQTLYYNVNGYYSYYGGGPNDVGFDDFVPNYLLGLPDTYSQGSAQIEKVRSTIFSLFAQDSWKIRPNLTLNYGLRWELFTPLTDISQHVQSFRPGQVSTVYPCQLSQASIDFFVNEIGFPNPDCNNTGVIPTGLVVPGDKGVPAGLTSTYHKTFAPRLGIAYSPGHSGKTSIRAGWGLFYNPMEQLVLEQFSAEPPFGGSNIINYPLFNTPFEDQNGVIKPNPFNGILDPPRNQPVDWSIYRPILLYGQFQPHLRTQYSTQYNLNIQRELTKDLVLQVGYVGSQGHRLLASHDINYGQASTCLGLQELSDTYGDDSLACGPFYADTAYFIPPTENGSQTLAPSMGLYIPYGPGGPTTIAAGTPISSKAPNGITLVGLRPYSAPNCNPYDGTGCPPDATPVFSSIFAEDTIANSNYNSLQVSLEKRFSHGLQANFAYTFSKSFDQASSFEGELNPLDFRSTYSLSQFDARHRVVLSYVWQLPVPKYSGFKGGLLNNWDLSGIYTFQSGFPIRITSSADNELMYSAFFEYPGEPDQLAPFHKIDPKKNAGNWFDPNSFTENATDDSAVACSDQIVFGCYDQSLLGRIGNAKRTICCGPSINNFDFAVHKVLPIGASDNKRFEFRAEIFNIFNHTQFNNPDGNTTDGSDFGRIKRAREPRLIQLAVKFYF